MLDSRIPRFDGELLNASPFAILMVRTPEPSNRKADSFVERASFQLHRVLDPFRIGV
jgi:hypothetical protein